MRSAHGKENEISYTSWQLHIQTLPTSKWHKYFRIHNTREKREVPNNKAGKAETAEELRPTAWQYIQDIVTPQAGSSTSEHWTWMKQLWTYIKQKKADDNTIPPIKSNGVLHRDSVDKAGILDKQFKMAFSSKSEITRLNKQFQMAFSSEVRNNHRSFQE